MSDPARQLEQLLAAERGRPDPADVHAQRVWDRVEGRLDGRIPTPAWAQSSTLVAWPWLLVGCGVIVTLAVLATRPAQPPVPLQTGIGSPISASMPTLELPDLRVSVPSGPEASDPLQAPEAAPPEAAARRPGTFAEELAIIERARGALGRGRYAEATAATREHRRRFPSGALTEEAAALRLATSCASSPAKDDVDDHGNHHRKELAAFTRRWPGSVHADLVDRHCR
jgi:hypothetical protein